MDWQWGVVLLIIVIFQLLKDFIQNKLKNIDKPKIEEQQISNNGLSIKLNESLEKRDFEKFVIQFKLDDKLKINEIFKLICIQEVSNLNYDKISSLAWFIFAERCNKEDGIDNFKINSVDIFIQELIYEIDIFRQINVPFEEYKNVVELLFLIISDIKKERISNKLTPKIERSFWRKNK